MRDTIFISYSHTDKEWLEQFENALKIGVVRELYNTWSDQQIPAGEEWDSTIEGKIASARIALLLVTPEFLRSTYIGAKELPTILDRHRKKGLALHWVPIKSVSDEKLRIVGLDGIQALWRLDQPLAELDPRNCKKAIESICDTLIRALGPVPDINNYAIKELENELKEKLGKTVVLGERIAFGDGSIIYKATEENEDIAVKMALPSMRRAWVVTDFVSRANRFRQMVNPLFVRIRKAYSDSRINWVTMDYLDLPSLKDLIKQSGKPGLQPEVVADVLAQVSLAASNLHQDSKGPNGSLEPLLVGPLRSSHIYRDPQNGKIKISPTQMSPATLQCAQARPLLMLQEDELTWLAPEQYAGERAQIATDQYFIGLLGLELLTGAPPVTIGCCADLDKKRAFFAAPMAQFEKLRKECPALFFVLARMLERRPEDRWPSMSEAQRALGQIAERVLPDELRRKARETYSKLQGSDFYCNFYEELFRISAGTRNIFESRNINMDEQRKKLHEAAGALLNFRATDDPNPMSRYAVSHHAFALQPEHFAAFRDAFLAALSKRKPKVDSYAVDAWRAILDAAIAYMIAAATQHDRETRTRARRVTRERSIRLVQSA